MPTSRSDRVGRLARVRRWIFVRHAHPISAWSRWATTPAVLLPLWRRRWSADPVAHRELIALNVLGSISLVTAGAAAWQHRRLLTAVGTGASMIITLLCWRRYAELYDRTTGRHR